MQLALFEADDTPDPRAASVTRRWERVLELAPDLHDILWRGDWREAEVEHALLLTLLHPSDRKKVIGKGKDHEAVLRQCARIVAHHEYDHEYDDGGHWFNSKMQLGDLSPDRIPDEDERMDRLESYIAIDEKLLVHTGEEVDRDLEQIITCGECIEFWRTAPQRRRALSAPREGTYRPSPINGTRRTKAAIESLKDAIYRIVEADQPMTVRQTFYRLVAIGAVDKSEGEYKQTVCRLLTEMRREGELPYHWIADNTRWMRKPRTFDSVEDALTATAETYRRAVWRDLPLYVEVWCEKDALAGVLLEETVPYDVPLMVARGFASESYLFNAAQTIAKAERPAHIYYFGDHDPSGHKIEEDIEKRLRGFAIGAEIHFERIAVTEDQIAEMNLPTRPTKRAGNMHAKGFQGDSVDLDAIPPLDLRRLVRECIERHIPPGYMDSLRAAEQSERELFNRIVGRGDF